MAKRGKKAETASRAVSFESRIGVICIAFICACALVALAISASGCSAENFGFVRTETGETEWSAESAQQGVENAQNTAAAVAAATGQTSNPIYIALTAAFSLVSGGLGIAAKVQSAQKNKMLVALKETTLAAAEQIKSENGDVKKLISAVKEIQEQTGTRDSVKASLEANENIANI